MLFIKDQLNKRILKKDRELGLELLKPNDNGDNNIKEEINVTRKSGRYRQERP